jgi:hypothetical protein
MRFGMKDKYCIKLSTNLIRTPDFCTNKYLFQADTQ